MPIGVGVPKDDVSSFSFKCDSGCNSAAKALFTYDSKLRLITISETFNNYTPAGTKVKFSVTGWTNPIDAQPYTFSINTIAYIAGVSYGIERFTDLLIKASLGNCNVLDIFVTDKDTRVYA